MSCLPGHSVLVSNSQLDMEIDVNRLDCYGQCVPKGQGQKKRFASSQSVKRETLCVPVDINYFLDRKSVSMF
jgi:hypothetical protein